MYRDFRMFSFQAIVQSTCDAFDKCQIKAGISHFPTVTHAVNTKQATWTPTRRTNNEDKSIISTGVM